MTMKFSAFNHNSLLNEDMDTVVNAGIELSQMCADGGRKKFADYDEKNAMLNEKIVKVCVQGTPYKFSGVDMVKNPSVTNDSGFVSRFAAIVGAIITPVTPAVVSDKFEGLAETRQVGFGDNAVFPVKSNQLFVVNEIAEGTQMGGLQRFYNNEFSVLAKPVQIRYDMPWYQVASGLFDWGEWSIKIGQSFAAYINMKIIKTYMEYIDGTSPAIYKVNGFSDANWIALSQKVSAVNGGSGVVAMGDLASVGTILPDTVGLQVGLGPDYAEVGHLNKYKGVRVEVIDPTIVPGTENTEPVIAIPTETIFMLPEDGYRPVKIVIEGNTVQVEAEPTKTADKVMGLTVTMRVGMGMVLGNRFGVITGVK